MNKQNNIKEQLKLILGNDAYSNGLDMQVSNRVSKLVKALNYLVCQVEMIKKDLDERDSADEREYIDKVLLSVSEILE